jgi:exodeoxyribonuclease-5
MVLTKAQEQGLKIALERYKNNEPYVTISGYAGTGKAQPVDTIIPTPTGDKRLGDIKVGDYVFDRNGYPTKVLGVYPQGVIDNYKITFNDGRSTYCGIDHLWTCCNKGKVFTVSTKEMLEKGVKKYTAFNDHTSYNFFIPCITTPVNYNPIDTLGIPPYTAGILLGMLSNLTYDETDETICYVMSDAKNYLEKMPSVIAEAIDAELIKDKYRKTFFYFKLRNFKERNEQYKKDFFTIIKEKKLPENYLISSASDRFEIMQGFFDLVGIVKTGKGFVFATSKDAATKEQDFYYRQILKILYSLGYVGSYIPKTNLSSNTTKMHLAVYHSDRPWQRLLKNSIYLDRALAADSKTPFAFYRQTSVKSIEKMPEPVEMVCIYVDNYEHLYLTENFIVTHNTTLVKSLIQSLPNVDPEKDVCYTAFTGKACQVLASMGNKNTSTLHRLLYKYVPLASGGYKRTPVEFLDYKVIVVDECSMVPQEFITALLAHGIYVIFLGDPAQLPPIEKDRGNNLLEHPHIFLTEIMRQAKDNDIIDLSMKVREGKSIEVQDKTNAKVFRKKDLNTGMLLWADIILCATNKTRVAINNQIRELKGFGDKPEEGDKIICLQNNWEKCSIDENNYGDPLVNGCVGFLHNPYFSFTPIPKWCNSSIGTIPTIVGQFVSEIGQDYGVLTMDKNQYDKGEETLDWKTRYKLGKSGKYKFLIPEQFTYGYAITCHKAQGSQWNKVLIIEENFPFDTEEHTRWVYTGLTRSSDKVVFIKKD